MNQSSFLNFRAYALAAFAALAATLPAAGEALLLVEADSGKVLQAENATLPWYPASTTKLMTAYVTLRAVREGRLALDTLLAVSPEAVAQQPSKMGFKAGTQVTVDNAPPAVQSRFPQTGERVIPVIAGQTSLLADASDGMVANHIPGRFPQPQPAEGRALLQIQ